MENAASDHSLQARVTHICHYSRDMQMKLLHLREQSESSLTLWRPWISTARDVQLTRSQGMPGDQRNFRSKGALGFQHPVRLYLPKSKSKKYLHNIGETVLSSFPVQATIHFYNDDTDSEDEEDKERIELYH
ncbi:protein ripply3 [Alligator mississippiensis]|uniref:Protein ripply3 n=1 Tax=Alligator mississippiensis TaxID=8496 RepID=A0A151ME86_ALLMI|nr:protein ripply3 [Alligator mississippiensis]KYO22821.1 protein ripply3 [Alligator mississippiensis]